MQYLSIFNIFFTLCRYTSSAHYCFQTLDHLSRCCCDLAPIDCCTPVSDVSTLPVVIGRWYRYRFDRRAFAVAGPTVWNSLPVDRRDPTISTDNFIHITEEWRRGCLEDTSVLSGLYRCRHDDALHKSIFTYLLTFNVTTRHCSVVFW